MDEDERGPAQPAFARVRPPIRGHRVCLSGGRSGGSGPCPRKREVVQSPPRHPSDLRKCTLLRLCAWLASSLVGTQWSQNSHLRVTASISHVGHISLLAVIASNEVRIEVLGTSVREFVEPPGAVHA